jgi:DNA-binding response OmpR family regulator
MQPITILVATADHTRREYLAAQLDADGHTIHVADSPTQATSKLATHAIDIVLLGAFDTPADAPALLRTLRAGQLHPRIHPAQPVITIGSDDDLETVRAYEAGSDHHVSSDSAYLVMRAVITTIARRTLATVTSRHLHIGGLHIDTAARTVDINGEPIKLSRIEFDLLAELATDPTRVFAKDELMQAVWGYSAHGRTRTLDSHACRLRAKLATQGAEGYIANRWGLGYKLLPTE